MYPDFNDRPKLSSSQTIDVSIVIPMRNEEENVKAVCSELVAFMNDRRERYEVIIVNDGSEDATGSLLERYSAEDERFTVIEFARSFGQAAAMDAGFQTARGRVIVPMDGDMQNDPADIPGLVAQLDEGEGSDIVSGWRKDRKDRWLSRRLPSVIANRLIRKLTWCDQLNDFGCSLKAYRREALEGIRLYGEMHRFLPALCKWRGARLSERVVNHRPRVAGESKYGIIRTFKVLLDLMTVKFLGDYLQKPMYFFAKLSFIAIAIACGSTIFATVQKFGYATEHGMPVMLNDSIFILFAMMMFLSAVILVLVGILAELMTRIYFESQGRSPYRVRRVLKGSVRGKERE
ncbi:glycosyltransferase family 2 protein [Pelagicoccus sp. SDUM812002]|nr:glycosyltransferase family 2 protein [Pelagicoccus sp. SDUM812002]